MEAGAGTEAGVQAEVEAEVGTWLMRPILGDSITAKLEPPWEAPWLARMRHGTRSAAVICEGRGTRARRERGLPALGSACAVAFAQLLQGYNELGRAGCACCAVMPLVAEGRMAQLRNKWR